MVGKILRIRFLDFPIRHTLPKNCHLQKTVYKYIIYKYIYIKPRHRETRRREKNHHSV